MAGELLTAVTHGPTTQWLDKFTISRLFPGFVHSEFYWFYRRLVQTFFNVSFTSLILFLNAVPRSNTILCAINMKYCSFRHFKIYRLQLNAFSSLTRNTTLKLLLYIVFKLVLERVNIKIANSCFLKIKFVY